MWRCHVNYWCLSHVLLHIKTTLMTRGSQPLWLHLKISVNGRKWRSAERILWSLVIPLLEKRLEVFSYYLTHQAQTIRQEETKLAKCLTHRCWLADYRLPVKPVSCVNHQLFCRFKSGLELTHRKLTISWVSQWQSGLRQLNLIALFSSDILKPVYAKHGSLKTSKWISSKTANKF